MTDHKKPATGEVQLDQLERMLRWFRWQHLPPTLQAVSRPFGELAEHIVRTIPASAERTVALSKLLEAKDAAVRASLPEEP